MKATYITRFFDRSLIVSVSLATTVALLMIMFGCQSPGPAMMANHEYDSYEKSDADPAAYGADHFTWHTQSPSRPQNTFQFYYKHCDRLSESPTNHYSKSDWGCSPTPF